MIKKIKTISNMAVFKDFEWEKEVLDNKGNSTELNDINIIYGRNYAGKTTLSRIFRAFEKGELSDKYPNASFSLELRDQKLLTHENLKNHDKNIRVFNEDYVRENLGFIVDETKNIKAFAVVMGSDNNKIQEKIEILEKELGSVENKVGLYGTKQKYKESYNDAETEHKNFTKNLTTRLTDKAREIKNDTATYKDVNYTIQKINKDIESVLIDTYTTPERKDIELSYAILKEENKTIIQALTLLDLQYDSLCIQTKTNLEKDLKPSNSIQYLLDDPELQEWVRAGRSHHKNKRTTCGFCGGTLNGLWTKLDAHFNQESEQLRNTLTRIKEDVEAEQKRINSFLRVNEDSFYSEFKQPFKDALEKFNSQVSQYDAALQSLVNQIKNRQKSIFTTLAFEAPSFNTKNLQTSYTDIDTIRINSNNYTSKLENKQNDARELLRLNEVKIFLDTIKYEDLLKTEEDLKNKNETTKKNFDALCNSIYEKETALKKLKASLNDEKAGAKLVNDLLQHSFGHQFLSLEAIKEDDLDKSYRFEVMRNKEKAYHLSEGEKSLISFCYFIAKLKESNTRMPVIWIDDPISSLDGNHIFFVYSVILSKIVAAEAFEQLFISTHNLEFLKYLKRLTGKNSRTLSKNGNPTNYSKVYFTICRNQETSSISLMPNYMKEYFTEFNYLFHQIYKCAHIEHINDKNFSCFYGFGNNARKFLEIFLYYKYPHRGCTDETLELFFGSDNVPVILTNRINNEFSHSSLDQGSYPIEVPEMKQVAQLILNSLRLDTAQYDDLLKSVGCETDVLVEGPRS